MKGTKGAKVAKTAKTAKAMKTAPRGMSKRQGIRLESVQQSQHYNAPDMDVDAPDSDVEQRNTHSAPAAKNSVHGGSPAGACNPDEIEEDDWQSERDVPSGGTDGSNEDDEGEEAEDEDEDEKELMAMERNPLELDKKFAQEVRTPVVLRCPFRAALFKLAPPLARLLIRRRASHCLPSSCSPPPVRSLLTLCSL